MKQASEEKKQSTPSTTNLTPKPSPISSRVESISTSRHEDGLKPPMLVTSIDFSNEKGKLTTSNKNNTAHPESEATVERVINPSSLPGNFKGESSNAHEDKFIESQKPPSRPLLQASPKKIQETLQEVYPPISTESLLQSATKAKSTGEGRILDESKAQLRANINKSLLESSEKVPEIPVDDAVNRSYEDREKQYRGQISQYYERNPSQKSAYQLNHSSGDIYSVHDDFSSLRQAIKPVTTKELEESLEVLKYEIHREVQEIIHEQVRQFNIAKVYYLLFDLLVYFFHNHYYQ